MNTHPLSQNQVTDPIVTPHGETVYEMIGRVAHHGGAVQHSLAHIILAEGKAAQAHHHKVCEESYYILKGQARMVIDGQELLLSPGQTCLILPPQVHQLFNTGEGALEFLAVCAPAWYPEDSYYD